MATKKLQFLLCVCFMPLLFLSLPGVLLAGNIDSDFLTSLDEKAKKKGPSKQAYLQTIHEADQKAEKGYYIKAKELLWEAIYMFPEVADAYINLATVNMKQGQYEAALRILSRAQDLAEPGYHQQEILSYDLGLCYYNLEDYTKASQHFSKALDVYPNFSEALYYLGLSYLNSGDLNNAFVKLFDARYQFEKEKKTSYLTKAEVVLSSLKAQEKIDKFLLADEFFKLAKNSLEVNDLPKAFYFFHESLILNPINSNTSYELALLYYGNQEFKNAILYLNKTLELKPLFTAAYLKLGDAYKATGRRIEAREAFQKAIGTDEKNPEVFYKIAKSYFKDNKLKPAKKYLDSAQELAIDIQDQEMISKIQAFNKEMGTAKSKTKLKTSRKKRRRAESEEDKPTTSFAPNNYGYLVENKYPALNQRQHLD